MKVIINGVEIEIMGGSRLVYDAEGDTLSVDPISDTKKAPAPKNKYNNEGERAYKPKIKSKLTQQELRDKILDQLSVAKDSISQQQLTIRCLEVNSKKSDQRYLKLLLDKMVEEKSIIRLSDTARARYKLP